MTLIFNITSYFVFQFYIQFLTIYLLIYFHLFQNKNKKSILKFDLKLF
jgi:hypothetical protein